MKFLTYLFSFPENVEQIEVFGKTVSPMVDKLFEGFHQTVFAYGQTGSGKTFTMGGEYRPDPVRIVLSHKIIKPSSI